MERGVPYVTDEGVGYYPEKKRRWITLSEATLIDISPVWSRIVFTASGAISQPWHHKLMQIRKELNK
ncbi:hypothetical protein D3C73_591380 [compost metagenome]